MSKEAEVLANAQLELYGKLSRTTDNLRKGGAAKITLGAVEARLQILESHWLKFTTTDDKLFEFREVIANTSYIKQKVADLAEEEYLKHKGYLLDLIRSAKPTEEAGPPPAATAPTPPGTRTTLPRIQLPSFSGKYEDWPSFRDLFTSIVGRDPSISRVEKLHYLKTCLKGEAELLIRNLSTTADNYDNAWTALKNFYENKRLLTRAYLSNFLALTKMKSESAVELRKLFHHVKSTVKSLETINRPIGSSEDLFVYLAVELLDHRSRREWETTISDTTEPPAYTELEQFLEKGLHTLEAMAPLRTENASNKSNYSTQKSSRAHLAHKPETKTENKRGRCSLCQQDHFVMLCADYKKKSALERKQHVTENSLCLNCLGRHMVSECASKKNCTACGERHHTSIHDACRGNAIAKSSHVARRISTKLPTVLLATARVRVADQFGDWHHVRALIDPGSETSFITERLTQRLKLSRSSGPIAVFGICGKKSGTSKGQIDLIVSPHFEESSLSVSALVLPRITSFTGGLSDGVSSWPHIHGLSLADPEYAASDPVELLLGTDIHATIIEPGLLKGGPTEPIAQKTSLGWILSGVVKTDDTHQQLRSLQCNLEDNLLDLVRRFWEQEEVPTSIVMSLADQECEDHFVRTHSRQRDGRYVVRLPIKEPLPYLFGTRRTAIRLLENMENKFKRERSFQSLYQEFMKQYVDLGHMSVADPENSEKARLCYLPHHGVMRESSSSTKLRVVFNGSSSLRSGISLNQHLHAGPNLLPSLASVLLQWRKYQYVFSSDIEKMYRQILVHPCDRDLQRIVWRDQPQQDLIDFRLNTVTYGLACAPFLAMRTLRQLADDEERSCDLGAAILRTEVYMDDILSGGATVSEAKEKQRQLINICRAGGFPLKKWSANTISLLEDIPTEDQLPHETHWWLPGESHSTLGLRWHPNDDQFSFSTPTIQLNDVTKRSVLSLTARLFDPLGWLSPVTIRAKIYFQSTWLQGLDWDTPLPDNDVTRWQAFLSELTHLEKIRIPRWLGGSPDTLFHEIHGFADASERAYAAVIYLRTEGENGRVRVRLLLSKTKVAPLKQVSLPRLELCAANLLVRLTAHVRQVLHFKGDIHLWSDSTVALGWLRGHPTSWTTYVANRVSEIQTTLPEALWHHVPGRDNPADCASRGIAPTELANHALWWSGPPWLTDDSQSWPTRDTCPEENLPEQRTRVHAVAAVEEAEESWVLTRFSSLNRLLRVTAWCRRWLLCVQSRNTGDLIAEVLQADELQEVLNKWIIITQTTLFKDELAVLNQNRSLSPRNSLAKLNPFVDERGVLRVGGRLRNASLPHEAKHPAILSDKSHLTRLIVESLHRKTLHGGVQLTLSSLRQEYWVPRGRTLVKGCIHRCSTCLRWRAATTQPRMGDLPAPRVSISRPFTNTGIDYAGPIWLRTSKGRGHKATKAFLAIFVCFSTRAVHLDVVSDYTADAFLAALRRFISRRGLCQTLYSDCGTNFVGADAQLRALFSAATHEGRKIANLVAQERIHWRFNPPAAPNFGGIWEAAVKSAKHHLRRVIGEATLTFEEMSTLLTQVEACLNSRPLQALTDDPDDCEALTPGHFLVGTALNAVPEPSLINEPASRLTRWQLLQAMRDHFWSRWSREYLNTLTHRPKWFQTQENVEPGRLCLLKSETTPPTKWPLARVEKLHPGKDGQTRVVTIRTATSTFTRPVNKLVLLPVSSAPESKD